MLRAIRCGNSVWKNNFHSIRPGLASSTVRGYANEVSDPQNDDNLSNPEYPEIFDLSGTARSLRSRQAWRDEVKNLKTIEEKLIKINIPRYYGFQNMILRDDQNAYGSLPYHQHWTRTLFEEGLPTGYFKQTPEQLDSLVTIVKGAIEDGFAFHLQGYR